MDFMQIMYSNYYWVFEDRRAEKVHIHDNEKCINNPIIRQNALNIIIYKVICNYIKIVLSWMNMLFAIFKAEVDVESEVNCKFNTNWYNFIITAIFWKNICILHKWKEYCIFLVPLCLSQKQFYLFHISNLKCKYWLFAKVILISNIEW